MSKNNAAMQKGEGNGNKRHHLPHLDIQTRHLGRTPNPRFKERDVLKEKDPIVTVRIYRKVCGVADLTAERRYLRPRQQER